MGTSKKLSVVLSALVMSFLLVLGPVNAVSLHMTQPNDAWAGDNVYFKLRVDIQHKDSNVPVESTDFVFTGPNGFSEICTVYNDGSYEGCDLDLDINVYINQDSYGYGYGYGYYNGYGYDLGYGYGYNPVEGEEFELFGEIVYNVVWHTSVISDGGDYKVKAITHAGNKEFESAEKTFEIFFVIEDACYDVFSLFQDEASTGIYDERLDLDTDGDVDVTDLALFTHYWDNEEWCANLLLGEEELYECSEGMIYIDTFSSTEESTLYTVDLTTGESTIKQVIEGDYKHNLAIDKNGNVYALRKDGDFNTELVTFNDNGSYEVIGSTDVEEKFGSAGFSGENKLYALGSEENALYEISTSTGEADLLEELDLDVESGDLVVNEDNVIVYLRNNGEVYSIDLDNSYEETYLGTLLQEGRIYTGLAYIDGKYYATTRNAKVWEFTINPFDYELIGPSEEQPESGDAASCPVPIDEEDEEEKVLVCHVPPGNPENAHTLSISENAVQAHLNHGDYLGECEQKKKNGSNPFIRNPYTKNNQELSLEDEITGNEEDNIDNNQQLTEETNEDSNQITGAATGLFNPGNLIGPISVLLVLILAIIGISFSVKKNKNL